MVRRSPSCRGWPRPVASVGSVLKPTPGLSGVARAYRAVGRKRVRTVRRELRPMIARRDRWTVRPWWPIVLAGPPPLKASGVGPRRQPRRASEAHRPGMLHFLQQDARVPRQRSVLAIVEGRGTTRDAGLLRRPQQGLLVRVPQAGDRPAAGHSPGCRPLDRLPATRPATGRSPPNALRGDVRLPELLARRRRRRCARLR